MTGTLGEQMRKFVDTTAPRFVTAAAQDKYTMWEDALQKSSAYYTTWLEPSSSTSLRQHVVDGGGSVSRGDWRIPPPNTNDVFKYLRHELLKYGVQRNLHGRHGS